MFKYVLNKLNTFYRGGFVSFMKQAKNKHPVMVSSLIVGDRVTISEGARDSETNAKISTKARSNKWIVSDILGEEVTIKSRDSEIVLHQRFLSKYTENDNTDNNNKSKSKSSAFKVGEKVNIKTGSTWCDGSKIPSYLYANTLFVLRSDDLITELCDKNKKKIGSVYTKDVRIKK